MSRLPVCILKGPANNITYLYNLWNGNIDIEVIDLK